jgi:hypothetical protein
VLLKFLSTKVTSSIFVAAPNPPVLTQFLFISLECKEKSGDSLQKDTVLGTGDIWRRNAGSGAETVSSKPSY